ncbi:hypothetical protein KSF_087500 [Reticulibacter mediterranei]|uniref:HAMP domain-containing protein n=1 Tax=Reticulibacter mediterranei TaxID=2778369 RepID=A0A8J3N8Y0_9CHLR|nr:hypothetical protein [Reticulibacter mediterranei]GHO98702.1 hypothetical protein KSF_087500 [Reticulibacter mediterranei]
MNTVHKPTSRSTAQWAHERIGEHRFRRYEQFFAWWFRFAAPPDAGAEATDRQRNAAQRGRSLSLLLLFLLPIMVGVGIMGQIGTNPQIFWTAIEVSAVVVACIFMNHLGKTKKGAYWGVNVSGITLAVSINIGMYLSILKAPHGMSLDDKDILYMLFFSEMIFGIALPAPWILVPLICNLAFSFFQIFFGHHTPELNTLLASSLWIVLIRIVQSHSFPLANILSLAFTTRESQDRANYTAKMVQFEHNMVLREQEEKEKAKKQAQQLEKTAHVIIQANKGDFSVRMPVEFESSLMQLAGPLNALIGQLQRSQEVEKQLRAYQEREEEVRLQLHHLARLRKEIDSTLQVIEAAEKEGKPIRLILGGGTPLESLQRILNGKTLQNASLFK